MIQLVLRKFADDHTAQILDAIAGMHQLGSGRAAIGFDHGFVIDITEFVDLALVETDLVEFIAQGQGQALVVFTTTQNNVSVGVKQHSVQVFSTFHHDERVGWRTVFANVSCQLYEIVFKAADQCCGDIIDSSLCDKGGCGKHCIRHFAGSQFV